MQRITIAAALFLTQLNLTAFGQAQYDLLLQGGHLVDAKNRLSGIRDIAIKDGLVAAVAEHIEPATAFKTINVMGLYVTPGLVDIHVHAYGSTGEANSYAGDLGLFPDGFTFRNGVTTVADAGSSGYRNFEDFKTHIIDRSKTRVLAFINIVGAGMRGGKFENNLADMEAAPTAEMAKRYPAVIVGVKTAHYTGPEWTPVEHAVEAGTAAHIPVMVDFGSNRPERPIDVLLTQKLRPGDIYTHCYSGLRGELDAAGKVNAGMTAGRQRGVFFDAGTGGGSFAWRIAVPAIQQGFLPDSLSTDLHSDSMNTGTKDLLNVMGKFLSMGLSVDDVIARSTWNPAHEIKHEELGNLSIGAIADISVLRVEEGNFGYIDMYGARQAGHQKFLCEMTLKDGKVVYDLNGLGRPDWKSLPAGYKQQQDRRWDATGPAVRKKQP
jgi:dihydroorotase